MVEIISLCPENTSKIAKENIEIETQR